MEELGFGSVWAFDHLCRTTARDDRPAFETLTTMGAMALLTSHARIGVLVNGVLYRDPAVLAKASAQLDEMTMGRLDFSLGAAWAEREYRAYGLPFPTVDRTLRSPRRSAPDRQSPLGGVPDHDKGRYYQLEEAPCEPKPVQSPHPPITVGGSWFGIAAGSAARHADRLNVGGDGDKMCRAFRETGGNLQPGRGHDFNEIELSAHLSVAVAPTHAEAETDATAANLIDIDAVREQLGDR